MNDPVTVHLSRSIQVVGEERHFIVLAEPNGGMLARAGSVVRIIHGDDDSVAIEPLPAGVLKLIAACGGVPVRSVEGMAGADFMECQSVVLGFLGHGEAKTSSTDISNVPAGGTISPS